MTSLSISNNLPGRHIGSVVSGNISVKGVQADTKTNCNIAHQTNINLNGLEAEVNRIQSFASSAKALLSANETTLNQIAKLDIQQQLSVVSLYQLAYNTADRIDDISGKMLKALLDIRC